jgi:DNA-binding NarL/FixJ family response regulator
VSVAWIDDEEDEAVGSDAPVSSARQLALHPATTIPHLRVTPPASEVPLRLLVASAHDGIGRLVDGLACGRVQPMAEVVVPLAGTVAAALDRHPEVVVAELRSRQGLVDLAVVAPMAPTVVVSSLPAESVLLPVMAAGARGFVGETEADALLADAVARVAAGHTYVDPVGADWLVDLAVSARQHDGGSTRRPTPARNELSERQAQVLELARDGLTNREIADALGVTPNSVKTHLVRAMRKLRAVDD